MTRCFIHIGAPKTGSTFLQRVLFDNRAALAAAGVLYPDVSLRGWGHHDLAFLLGGGYPDWATPQPMPLSELLAQLRAAVRDHDGPVVLSSENFFLFPAPAALREALLETGALAGRQPQIVVYVRAQDDAYESWYNQAVKAQGETRDLEACIGAWHDMWDYRLQLERWASVFGEENVVVRLYEDEQFVNGSIAGDFLSVVGVPAAGIAIPQERINSGLNRDVLEFQRLLNRLPLTVQEKRSAHRQLIDLCARTAGGGLFDERPVLSSAQRLAIRAQYQESNADVASRYLGRPNLFREDRIPEARSSDHPLTVEKLTYIVGWLLARDR